MFFPRFSVGRVVLKIALESEEDSAITLKVDRPFYFIIIKTTTTTTTTVTDVTLFQGKITGPEI